jgi:hypothetical protein
MGWRSSRGHGAGGIVAEADEAAADIEEVQGWAAAWTPSMPHIAGWFARAEQAGGCWRILRGLLG